MDGPDGRPQPGAWPPAVFTARRPVLLPARDPGTPGRSGTRRRGSSAVSSQGADAEIAFEYPEIAA
jgi:hypothetical protein